MADAEGGFAEALALHPQDARALLAEGILYLVAAEYAEASDLLTQAAKLAPRDSVLSLYQGASYHSLGQSENAVIYWQRGRSVDVFLWWLGRDSLAQGDREKAFALWRLAERVDSTPRREKRQMYRHMCATLSRQGDWDEALCWCEQAFAADPVQEKELVLAHAYVGVGRVADAEVIAERVLSSGTASPSVLGTAHWVLARGYTYQGRFAEALREFSLAVDLMGEDKYVYLDLARLHFSMGQYDEVERTLQLVQDLDRGSGVLAQDIRELRGRLESPQNPRSEEAE